MISTTASTDGIVENLVTQFGDPLDAFRELVQNSIDAGSSRIEVWAEFELGDDYTGIISLHVDDFGEGMDEAIIDNQLTQLFSSSKEDDLTKIGKFGIGFVSIFALKPHAVMVRTGRAGEYWEILFDANRAFSKTRLAYPVEGTQITLFLQGDRDRYNALVHDIPETLTRWCMHSDTEITFLDQTPSGDAFPEPVMINRPFGVDGELEHVKTFEDGTTVAVAFADSPVYGFYNRGLTLAYTTIGVDVFSERRARAMSGISAKIKSRYLEHTLSRDTIVRDENYDKAMRMLDATVRELWEKLIASTETLAAAPELSGPDLNRYSRWMGYLGRLPDTHLGALAGRRVFRLLHGGARHARELETHFRGNGWRLILEMTPNALTARLADDGVPVIHGAVPGTSQRMAMVGAPMAQLLQRLLVHLIRWTKPDKYPGLLKEAAQALQDLMQGEVITRIQRGLRGTADVYVPVIIDAQPPAELAPLVAEAGRLLREVDRGYRRLTTATSVTTHSGLRFVVGHRLGDVMEHPPAEGREQAFEAAILRDTPHFRSVLALAERHPRMAAYMLAKSLLLTGDSAIDDLPMIRAAITQSYQGGHHGRH